MYLVETKDCLIPWCYFEMFHSSKGENFGINSMSRQEKVHVFLSCKIRDLGFSEHQRKLLSEKPENELVYIDCSSCEILELG